MSTDKTVPPPPANSPAWFADFKAKAEEANWDKEGKLRGQEERNQLLWLKAYGFVVFLFLVFFSLLFVGSLGSWALHYPQMVIFLARFVLPIEAPFNPSPTVSALPFTRRRWLMALFDTPSAFAAFFCD